MNFKQYDFDTSRVVMVENPDGAYVLASDARNLVRRILELEEEVKGLQGRLGVLDYHYEESRTVTNEVPIRTDQIFFR